MTSTLISINVKKLIIILYIIFINVENNSDQSQKIVSFFDILKNVITHSAPAESLIKKLYFYW